MPGFYIYFIPICACIEQYVIEFFPQNKRSLQE
jgi:hypothetical protein